MYALLITLPVVCGGLATGTIRYLADLRRVTKHLSLNVLFGIALPIGASLALPSYGQGQLLFDGSAKQCVFYFSLSLAAFLLSGIYLRLSQVGGAAGINRDTPSHE